MIKVTVLFANETQRQATLGSPEGQAAVADIPRFASGGAAILVGAVA